MAPHRNLERALGAGKERGLAWIGRIPTLRLAVSHQQLRVHADRITDELTTLPVTW